MYVYMAELEVMPVMNLAHACCNLSVQCCVLYMCVYVYLLLRGVLLAIPAPAAAWGASCHEGS